VCVCVCLEFVDVCNFHPKQCVIILCYIVVTIIDYNCNIKVAVGVDGAWYMIFNLLEVHIEMVESLLKTQYALTMSFNAMPIISPIWIYCVVQGHNELGRCLPSLEI
jgi:hypothetical protein